MRMLKEVHIMLGVDTADGSVKVTTTNADSGIKQVRVNKGEITVTVGIMALTEAALEGPGEDVLFEDFAKSLAGRGNISTTVEKIKLMWGPFITTLRDLVEIATEERLLAIEQIGPSRINTLDQELGRYGDSLKIKRKIAENPPQKTPK